jgi:hypothetical protein
MMTPVLVLHGIWNRKAGARRDAAAAAIAAKLQPRLADGYRDGSLKHLTPPRLAAAYYADLLDRGAQGAYGIDILSTQERDLLGRWLVELGLPGETAQGLLTMPLRQALDWLALRSGRSAEALARLMTAVLSEVYVYLTRPSVRRRVREVVAEALDRHRPQVVVAHSLGSVIGYETLHATGAEVDLLLTLGSPLGLPGTVFEALDPEPTNGKGARPPGVRRWVNIADPGDVVAVPKRLGDRFPVDLHDEAYLGAADPHTLSGYLSCGLVAAAIAPYVPDLPGGGVQENHIGVSTRNPEPFE